MDLTSYRESSKKVAEFLNKVPPVLLDSGTLVRVPAGQVVVRQEEPVKYAWFLLMGELLTFSETEDGKKKRVLDDYIYDLGECMFCELCVNACPHDAIKFVNDFENATFSRGSLVQHLNKEKFETPLPNLTDGGVPLEIGKFNTGIK